MVDTNELTTSERTLWLYHEKGLWQASLSFNVSLFFAVVGFCFLLVSIVSLLRNDLESELRAVAQSQDPPVSSLRAELVRLNQECGRVTIEVAGIGVEVEAKANEVARVRSASLAAQHARSETRSKRAEVVFLEGAGFSVLETFPAISQQAKLSGRTFKFSTPDEEGMEYGVTPEGEALAAEDYAASMARATAKLNVIEFLLERLEPKASERMRAWLQGPTAEALVGEGGRGAPYDQLELFRACVLLRPELQGDRVPRLTLHDDEGRSKWIEGPEIVSNLLAIHKYLDTVAKSLQLRVDASEEVTEDEKRLLAEAADDLKVALRKQASQQALLREAKQSLSKQQEALEGAISQQQKERDKIIEARSSAMAARAEMIGVLVGAVLEAIAGLLFVLSNSKGAQMKEFFAHLATDRNQQLALAQASHVEGQRGARLRSALAIQLVGAQVSEALLLALEGTPHEPEDDGQRPSPLSSESRAELPQPQPGNAAGPENTLT